jgi:hypothetical protein
MVDPALFSQVQIAEDGASWPEHGFMMCCSEQRSGIRGCGVSSLDSVRRHISYVVSEQNLFRSLDESVGFMVDNNGPQYI